MRENSPSPESEANDGVDVSTVVSTLRRKESFRHELPWFRVFLLVVHHGPVQSMVSMALLKKYSDMIPHTIRFRV